MLARFRKAWPVDQILKQWLSYLSLSIKKDFEAEAEDKDEPDLGAIEKYLRKLSGGKAAGSDESDCESGSDIDMEVDEIRKALAEGHGDSDVEDEQISKASKASKASKTSKKQKGQSNINVDEADQTPQQKTSKATKKRGFSKGNDEEEDENEIPISRTRKAAQGKTSRVAKKQGLSKIDDDDDDGDDDNNDENEIPTSTTRKPALRKTSRVTKKPGLSKIDDGEDGDDGDDGDDDDSNSDDGGDDGDDDNDGNDDEKEMPTPTMGKPTQQKISRVTKKQGLSKIDDSDNANDNENEIPTSRKPAQGKTSRAKKQGPSKIDDSDSDNDNENETPIPTTRKPTLQKASRVTKKQGLSKIDDSDDDDENEIPTSTTKKLGYSIDDYEAAFEPGTSKRKVAMKPKTSKKHGDEPTTSKAVVKPSYSLVGNKPKAAKSDDLKIKKRNILAQKAAATVEPQIKDQDVEEEEAPLFRPTKKGEGIQVASKDASKDAPSESSTSRVDKGKGREGHAAMTTPVKRSNPAQRKRQIDQVSLNSKTGIFHETYSLKAMSSPTQGESQYDKRRSDMVWVSQLKV